MKFFINRHIGYEFEARNFISNGFIVIISCRFIGINYVFDLTNSNFLGHFYKIISMILSTILQLKLHGFNYETYRPDGCKRVSHAGRKLLA
jgi:hypothetical protein